MEKSINDSTPTNVEENTNFTTLIKRHKGLIISSVAVLIVIIIAVSVFLGNTSMISKVHGSSLQYENKSYVLYKFKNNSNKAYDVSLLHVTANDKELKILDSNSSVLTPKGELFFYVHIPDKGNDKIIIKLFYYTNYPNKGVLATKTIKYNK